MIGCDEEDWHEQNLLVLKNLIEESNFHLFKDSMLDYFSENPFVLDSYLSHWIHLLVKEFESFKLDISRIFYSLFKIRGEKSCTCFLPNAIEAFPKFIDYFIETFSLEAEETWKIQYVLILWIGQFFKLPFQLRNHLDENYKPKFDSMLILIEAYAKNNNFLNKPCSQLLARLGYPYEDWPLLSKLYYLNELSKINPDKVDLSLIPEKSHSPLEIKLSCKILKRLNKNVDLLLKYSFYNDSQVRFTASKGVAAQIFNQKQANNSNFKEFVERVLNYLINFKSFNGADLCRTFHGGALLIGEFCRLGLISKDQFDLTASIIVKFLCFEYSKGTFALGSNVRDAACYAVWALVRSYSDYLTESIPHRLIFMSLFDREVGCRRAAAAAFQELVGRCNLERKFSHGIEILQFINFHTVNLDSLNSLKELIKFESFSEYLITEFISRCIMHWDIKKRRESVELFNIIYEAYPEKTIEILTNQEPANDEDFIKIHGFYLALSKINHSKVMALVERGYENILQLDVKDVAFELLSEAYLNLLISFPYLEEYKKMIPFINSCLVHRLENISTLAVSALFSLNTEYANQTEVADLMKGFLPKADKSLDSLARIGYCRALAAIPLTTPPGPFLRLSLKIAERTSLNIEERLAALEAHKSLIERFYSESNIEQIENWNIRIFKLGFDWTIDNTRGDVGSFIRLKILLLLTFLKNNKGVVSQDFESLAWRMACERLDRVRAEALNYLSLLYNFDCLYEFIAKQFHLFSKNCQYQILMGLISQKTGLSRCDQRIDSILEKYLGNEIVEFADKFDEKLWSKFKSSNHSESQIDVPTE
jgi:hypothetical protein